MSTTGGWGVDATHRRLPHAGHIADIRELRREFRGVRATYERVGAARGQARYTAGAAVGAASIVGLTGLIAAVVGSADHTIWLGTLAGGALGGPFSVLERLTRRALEVRFESDRLLLSGISRPVVGAIAGVALFALIEGTIVPLDVHRATRPVACSLRDSHSLPASASVSPRMWWLSALDTVGARQVVTCLLIERDPGLLLTPDGRCWPSRGRGGRHGSGHEHASRARCPRRARLSA